VNTTVPWAPLALVLAAVVVALVVDRLERRLTRRDGTGWKAPGW
jgi:hypothetical protein